jgi:hypothetical protein
MWMERKCWIFFRAILHDRIHWIVTLKASRCPCRAFCCHWVPVLLLVMALVSFKVIYLIYGHLVICYQDLSSLKVMLFFHVISWNFMSFMWIHVKSCYPCPFRSIHANLCQFMPFVSFVTLLFQKFSKVESGEGGVKYFFLSGLRRQLSCLAEGKNRWWLRSNQAGSVCALPLFLLGVLFEQ